MTLRQAPEPAESEKAGDRQQYCAETTGERGHFSLLLDPSDLGSEMGVDLLQLARVGRVEIFATGGTGDRLQCGFIQTNLRSTTKTGLYATLANADGVHCHAFLLGSGGS